MLLIWVFDSILATFEGLIVSLSGKTELAVDVVVIVVVLVVVFDSKLSEFPKGI